MKNKLRALLDSGAPSVSTRISSTWPVIAEATAASGQFDYVEFLAEYAPFSQYDLENLARALELHGVSGMIKLDLQNRAYVGQKALASGFQALLLTDHRTPDEVRESIRIFRANTPRDGGGFGYPGRRWSGFSPDMTQTAYADMLRGIVIAVMIENKDAMDHIEEICAIEGVDMVQFGPSDYSLSRGWDLRDHLEEVRAEERRMISVALAAGVHPRCEVAAPEAAAPYIELGVRHFSIGSELQNHMRFCAGAGAAMRKMADALPAGD